jgi:uncharacterized protein (UPF0276 family)
MTSTTHAVPPRAGIGLRAEHYVDMLGELPATGWLEAHSENYFGDGGKPLHYLERLRAHYPLSLHGVGLSIGSTDPLNRTHLRRLDSLVRCFQPGLVSEHLSWGSVGGMFTNDLLPLPYTEEALAHMCERIGEVQDFLGRRILIENVSSYLEYAHSTIAEWDFLAELARRSGCGILLDVNNIYVSSCNHGFDPMDFIAGVPAEHVGEIHLAGHTHKRFDDGQLLIDTHNRPVADAVWRLYDAAVQRIGRRPTLIEWDTDLPALGVLLAEADKADDIMDRNSALVA